MARLIVGLTVLAAGCWLLWLLFGAGSKFGVNALPVGFLN
jgi:hypothetical protein